eukprot:TRINITY_DN4013_c1_g4_i1.p1 TRINITY_DN4013_c1_g4~~TRINITY_DN4013_c1_g4_i1.p1  ORF type:complete len:215 (+),score=15.66 TRINITY_DN4013_c1_g4_i1:291-935(+)
MITQFDVRGHLISFTHRILHQESIRPLELLAMCCFISQADPIAKRVTKKQACEALLHWATQHFGDMRLFPSGYGAALLQDVMKSDSTHVTGELRIFAGLGGSQEFALFPAAKCLVDKFRSTSSIIEAVSKVFSHYDISLAAAFSLEYGAAYESNYPFPTSALLECVGSTMFLRHVSCLGDMLRDGIGVIGEAIEVRGIIVRVGTRRMHERGSQF